MTSLLSLHPCQVGGEATVFHGVMVKVKCPVRHFDRSRITWWKEGRKLGLRPDTSSTSHVHVTRKGAIKINRIYYTDSGVYICQGTRPDAVRGNTCRLVLVAIIVETSI